MDERLMNYNSFNDVEESTVVHVDNFTFKNVILRLTLKSSGIWNDAENQPILNFSQVIGVNRLNRVQLSFVSYPKQIETKSRYNNCCANGSKEQRYRMETTIIAETEEIAKKWEDACWKMLLKDFVELKGRHERKFLILLNPKSGTGKSEEIFDKIVFPLFKDAHIDCTLIKTEYSGHASKICKETVDLVNQYDGIVIVSGDGLLFEVIQGLMQRPDWANVVKNIYLGIVPGGSGNGLAMTIAQHAQERKGPLSNSFLIAKGYTSPMDLCSVEHFGRGKLYSFLSFEYGFVCDMDIGSDYMRNLGEIRFTLEGLKLLISPKTTKCKLSYLPIEGAPHSPRYADRIQSYWDDPNCYVGEDGPKSSFHCPLDSPVPTNWISVEDNFYFMWNSNVAWVGETGLISPHSHLNDGYTQLCFYRKSKGGNSRAIILKFLLALENGSHVEIEDGSSKSKRIEMFPTRAYRVEPMTTKIRTRMGVDGEEVEFGPIQFEVLSGLITIMGVSS